MKTRRATLTLDGRQHAVTLHETESSAEYTAERKQRGIPLVWYERLGFPARAFADGPEIITNTRDAKLIAHELRHIAGHHHPNTPLAGILHAIRTGFSIDAFTFLLRWRYPIEYLHAANNLLEATPE